LFVPHDDVRSGQIEQALQTVVTVDHATIQVVQIGGREAATIQRNQRTQVRRQHRQNGQNHPLRQVARPLEGFHQFQSLGQLLDLGFRVGLRNLFAQAADLVLQINGDQQFANGFGTHAGIEVIAKFFKGFEVLLIVQQLTLFQGSHARIDHHVAFEIKHELDVTQGHVQQQADTGRQRLQEPDVGDRRGQFNVRHALTTNLGQGHFHTTLLADYAAMLEALVLTAQALVVLDRAKDLGAEQTIALRLKGTVVDGFRLFYFAERPGTDHLRRSQTDTDRIELFNLTLVFQQIQQVFQGLSSSRTCGDRLLAGRRIGGACYSVSSSMSIPSERISLISTLKDSGMPASMR